MDDVAGRGSPVPEADGTAGPSPALISVLTLAAGALIANLYYAQPLVAAIGPAVGISRDLAGSIVSMTQVGYGIGLFFIVSLADLVENKRLVLTTLSLTTLGLVGAATANGPAGFFAASLVIGVCSAGAQVLLPFVAHLIPAARRGRVVGKVMAGVLTGIMLARPAALFVSAAFGWRAIFALSAAVMVAIGIALVRMMPTFTPSTRTPYRAILSSMIALLWTMPAVRWRAAYQALMFCAFNLFWTAVPLYLADRFGLGERGIGLFALAGCGGAVAAPMAGRLADAGHTRRTTAGAMLVLGLSFLASCWSGTGAVALATLTVLAILIDAAVQANQVVGQRVIFSVASEHRGRVNAIYMTCLFIGAAIGSVLGTATYHRGGWPATGATGAGIGLLLLVLFAFEARRPGAAGSRPADA